MSSTRLITQASPNSIFWTELVTVSWANDFVMFPRTQSIPISSNSPWWLYFFDWVQCTLLMVYDKVGLPKSLSFFPRVWDGNWVKDEKFLVRWAVKLGQRLPSSWRPLSLPPLLLLGQMVQEALIPWRPRGPWGPSPCSGRRIHCHTR